MLSFFGDQNSIKGFIKRRYQDFWPALCLLCHKEICEGSTEYICRDCLARVPWRKGNERSLPLLDNYYALSFATERERRQALMLKCAVACYYLPPLPGLVSRLKFHSAREHAFLLAELLHTSLLHSLGRNYCREALWTAIPLSALRLKQRSYNQSELIATRVAQLMGAQYLPLLERLEDGARQSEMSRGQRYAAVHTEYCVSHVLYGRRIIVVDDVLTTGATMYAAVSALWQAGAADVQPVAVACGRGQGAHKEKW